MQPTRWGLFVFAALWLFVIVPISALAAPYAAYVMDARTGETLYSENADTRLHPASLTKMMTLYIAFEEIERGRLSLDTMVTVSNPRCGCEGKPGTVSPWYMLQPSLREKSCPMSRPASEAAGAMRASPRG